MAASGGDAKLFARVSAFILVNVMTRLLLFPLLLAFGSLFLLESQTVFVTIRNVTHFPLHS